MANNSNVSNAIYPYDSYEASFLVGKNANIDANYGPWESTLDYETWHGKKTPSQIKEGTLIAIKASDSSDVTLHVYSNGTWKPVGSGGTGADDIGYIPDNVDVDILEKKVVSTSANQGLNPTQQDNARRNIGAVATDTYNSKVTELTGMIHNLQVADTDPGSAYALRQELTSGLALKADKSNTVTTDATNQTISGEMVFKGGVTFDCETDFTSESQFEDAVTFKDAVDIIGNLNITSLSEGVLVKTANGIESTTDLSAINNSSNAVQSDWNEASTTSLAFIKNKPNLSDYLTKSGGTINGNLAVSGKISGSGGIEIVGVTAINGDTNIGTSTNKKDLTVSKNATVENDFVAKGNVSLGTEASSTAKTITLGSTTGAGNVADNININGIITSDVTIGKTDSAANNKNLTVNGNATLTSAGIGNCSIAQLNLLHENFTANSVLKLNGNKKVVSDTGTYMKFRSEVDTYDDLSNISEPIAVGDVFYIKDTDSQVVATEITSDKNLRVIYSTDVNVTLDTDSEGTTPILSTSDFFSAFSTDGAFDAYPTFAYTYHKIYYNGSNVGDLKIVPVRTSEYGIIIALVSATASKAWAASTTYDGGERNVWYIEGMLSNGSGVVELDVTHSTIPSGRNIKEFVIFGGGVTWKSIGRKTTNMISMIPVTEDTEYAEIESILLAGNIPYLYSMDSNCKYGNQYHFCGGYTANSIDYYTFESVTYDNGSFKKVIKICEEATDPTWTTKTVTLTIDA